jgi:ketosteroid isomerase-like protein
MPTARPSNDDIASIADRLDIAEVLSRYSYGWDTRDFEMVRSCFTPDAEISYSSLPPFPGGFSEFFELECQNVLKLDATQHLIANLMVKVAGDTATCTSYVQATHYVDGGEAWVTGGRYDDELRRTDDGWRICKRTFTRQWKRDNSGLSERYLTN